MFTLRLPGEIVFGRGSAKEAAARVVALGRRVGIVRSASAGFADRLAAELRDRGAEVGRVTAAGEPDLAALEAALGALRPLDPDVIVGIGGGAALDLAKAVAALLPAPEGVMAHLEVVGEGRPLSVAPLPVVALPTTRGTGAEATKNAVIGVPEAGRKVSLRDDRMVPRLALVDPDLGDGVPRAVRLASGLDAVTQVIEPYLSSKANPLTDALCADAIPRGLAALQRDLAAGDGAGGLGTGSGSGSGYGVAAREGTATGTDAGTDMALVALTGGLALANAGLGAVHGLAGVLGGQSGAPHGALCGRLLVPVLRANLARLDTEKARRVAGWIDAAFGSLDGFERWIDAQGLPRLAEMGVAPGSHADIAKAALAASSMKGNPVPLDAGTLVAILEAA